MQHYVHIAVGRPVSIHLVFEAHVEIIHRNVKAFGEIGTVVLRARAVKIVGNKTPVALAGQRLDGVGANEPRAAGDQPLHAEISLSAVARYHSSVRSRPSCNRTRGRQPSSTCALVGSETRYG